MKDSARKTIRINKKIKLFIFHINPLDSFLEFLGGKVFRNGLFNSFNKEQIDKWNSIVENAFPEFINKFNLFVNTKFFKDGTYAAPCKNCKITFEGVRMPEK